MQTKRKFEKRIKFVKNRKDIERETGVDYSDSVVIFSRTIEREYLTIKLYQCEIQDLYYRAAELIQPERDNDKNIKAEREKSVKQYEAAKNIVDNTNLLKQLSKRDLPITNKQGLPGFRMPNTYQKNIGINNPYSKYGGGDNFLNLAKNLFCGDFDHLFDLGKLPQLNLPDLNLPDFNLGVDMNVNIDECLGKYLPPMFETKRALGSGISLGNAGFGKLGDMAKSMAGKVKDALSAVNKVVDKINDAIAQVQGIANDAINKVVGTAKKAINKAIGKILGGASGFTSGLKGALSKVMSVARTIGSAISTAASVALGAIGFFNSVKSSLSGYGAGILNSLLGARQQIDDVLHLLTRDRDIEGVHVGVRQNIVSKLLEAKEYLNKGIDKFTDYQDFVDDVEEKRYRYTKDEYGNVVKEYLPDKEVKYDNKYKIGNKIVPARGQEEYLYCGVPREGDDEVSKFINKLQKQPTTYTTHKTTAKEAQLQSLAYTESLLEATRIKEKNWGQMISEQGCYECNEETYKLVPSQREEDYEKERDIRDELVDKVEKAKEKENTDEGMTPDKAKDKAKREAENDTVVKIYDKYKPDIEPDDYINKDKDEINKDILDKIKDKLPEELHCMDESNEITRKEKLKAIDKFVFLEKKDCSIFIPSYDSEEKKEETQPLPKPDYGYEIKEPITEDESGWVLKHYHCLEEKGGVNYFVDTYVNENNDELKYYYRVADGKYVIENYPELLIGKTEKEAQHILKVMTEVVVEIITVRDGKEIGRWKWKNKCSMVDDILDNKKINIEDEYKKYKDSKKDEWEEDYKFISVKIGKKKEITIKNKLTGDEEIIDIPKELSDPIKKPKINVDDSIEKGSRLCNEIIEYLINKDGFIQKKLEEKKLKKDTIEAYEYVRYVLLPSNAEMYESALEVCQSGRFEEYMVKKARIDVGWRTRTTIIEKEYNPEVKVKKVVYKGKDIEVELPEKIQSKFRGAWADAGVKAQRGIVYVDIYLSNRKVEREELEPYRVGGTIYYPTLLASEKDKIVFRDDERDIYSDDIEYMESEDKIILIGGEA